MGAKIGSVAIEELLGLHALTDCNNCNNFKKQEKNAALDLLLSNDIFCNGIKQLEQDFNLSKGATHNVGKLCLLYRSKRTMEVNSLTYDMQL